MATRTATLTRMNAPLIHVKTAGGAMSLRPHAASPWTNKSSRASTSARAHSDTLVTTATKMILKLVGSLAPGLCPTATILSGDKQVFKMASRARSGFPIKNLQTVLLKRAAKTRKTAKRECQRPAQRVAQLSGSRTGKYAANTLKSNFR
jgi:hypothetical protein